MNQTTFSDAEYANKKKQTRRDRFLVEIEAVMPWPALVTTLSPYYPKGDGHSRAPVGWSGCSAYTSRSNVSACRKGIEYAVYDGQAIRGFIGIDPAHESAATTLLKFRLLEKLNLTCRLFDEISGHLGSKRLMMGGGTIVDATLIVAPPSAKNRDEKLDLASISRRRARTGSSA